MEIRRICSDDLNGFWTLWQSVFNEGIYLRSPPPPKHKIDVVLNKITQQKIPQFVAIIDNEVVASVEAFPGTMCGQHSDEVGFIGAQVHSDFRGQGIAKKLLEAVLLDSRRFGFKELKLEVYESNLVAQKLYEKFGFQYTGEKGEVELPSGQKEHSLKMSLPLKNKH
ncbi:Acetyltransferase YpeA [Grimontia celer]|uniref:Acetyltransferase YpeA n=1 Tax=Grimontia celer TaxID=1796497 RepID=A0A128EZH6_9GAMM|nr:GNAT family N-acetyltransferase [Grimontia celer]CZF79550.1 Acetyltransferase YpeA [Grimontia celer]